MNDTRPVTDAEFAALVAEHLPIFFGSRIAVGVSGGGDSMALALLAARWARANKRKMIALTVDHGLRPESAAEAQQVGRWLADHKIPHRILTWTGAKPASNKQALAREARYRLMGEACMELNAGQLWIAHHLEDQAETFLLRAGRGSGVDGLAAMAPVVALGGGSLFRPLLNVPKARLLATLRAAKQDWIEDPSNSNPAYQRVRVRQAMASLAPDDLAARHLAQTARNMARARDALRTMTSYFLRASTIPDPAGFIRLDLADLRKAPLEIGLRALVQILFLVGNSSMPPRLERLERLHHDLCHDALAGGRTLLGCRILAVSAQEAMICREARAVAGPLALSPGQTDMWDGRFRVCLGSKVPRGLRVAALGRARLPETARNAICPGPVRPSLPALWDGDEIWAVPALGFAVPALPEGGFTAEFRGMSGFELFMTYPTVVSRQESLI